MEHPEIYTGLNAEIDGFDSELFPPTANVKQCEREIGVVTGWPRKLYALAKFYRREEDRLEVELKYDDRNQELYGQLSLIDLKHKLLLNIFWFCATEQLHAWRLEGELAVRSGWRVVEHMEHKNNIPDIIEKLFGG